MTFCNMKLLSKRNYMEKGNFQKLNCKVASQMMKLEEAVKIGSSAHERFMGKKQFY